MHESRGKPRQMTRRCLIRGATAGAGAALLGLPARAGAGARVQEKTYRIVLIPGEGGGNFFYVPMACGAQAAAQEAGVTLDVVTPQNFDPDEQIPLLESVIEARPDAILIVPTDRTALIAPIRHAVDAGIPVFTLDTAIDADLALANIASDNVEGGRTAARALAAVIDGRGKVFVVNTTPGVSSTDQREEGFAAEIATHPGITYLGQEYDRDDPDIATSLVRSKLQEVPDLAGIFATSLPGGLGAGRAIELAKAEDRVTVVAFDAAPDQVEQLRRGSVDALIAQHPYEMGYTGVAQAVAHLDTDKAPEENVIATGYSVVTRENLDDPAVARYLYVLDCSAIPVPASAAATPAS
jgi:ribose transport system substrate-binding protein